MWKSVVVIALVAFATAQKVRFDNYKVYEIVPKTEEQLETLRQFEKLGSSQYDFWRHSTFVHRPMHVMVLPTQVPEITEFLKTNGFAYRTYIENVQQLIDNENPVRVLKDSKQYDFKSYLDLEELYAYMDSLVKQYPDKVEIIIAGKTYEGRDMKGVKISHRKNNPIIFIESGAHAREWIAPATATYIMNELLISNNTDIRALAESYDFHIVPSTNPDGYAHTHKEYRLWRKTRSPGICKGTDPNRNWDIEWNTVGASSDPCEENYAGKKPFSEIETRTLAEYIKSIKDEIFMYISFHSYSQLLFFPYGHTVAHLENYDDLYAIAGKGAEALAQRYGTEYAYGNSAETIYLTSGSSLDYVKGKLKVDLCLEYEMRDEGLYGFILPADQIIPNSEEILDSMIAMVKEAKRLGYPKSRV